MATHVPDESNNNWLQFCDHHAKTAASDFAKSFLTYITANLPENARQTVSHRDFLKKFLDSFVEHFESELQKRRGQKISNGRSNSHEDFSGNFYENENFLFTTYF